MRTRRHNCTSRNGKLLLGRFNGLWFWWVARRAEERCGDAIKPSALCCWKAVENYSCFRCRRRRPSHRLLWRWISLPAKTRMGATIGVRLLLAKQVHDHVRVTCLMSDVRWCFHIFFHLLSILACVSILFSSWLRSTAGINWIGKRHCR